MTQISFDSLKPTYKITKPIRLIELFAGIGAQAKALESLGADFEHYRICEFDKFAVQSYNAIHGTDFTTSDITVLKGDDLGITDTDKYCYIMTYSFPCQDLSICGKQKGMSKAVMISIKPQWCELISKKQKTIEVRKTKPKLKTPFKCYIYETKGLYRGSGGCLFQGLGKVIGEFVCDYIEEYSVVQSKIIGCVEYQISLQKLCEDINLSIHEFCSYGNGKPLYGWHISDLVIYDKPKELYEFNKLCTDPYQYCECCKHGLVQYPSYVETYEDLAGCCYDTVCLNQLQKPPQSWCYVEVKQ